MAPTSPQDAKMVPRWPNMAPRLPQDVPKMASHGPRWPKKAARWPQDGPRMASGWPMMAQARPKMAQDLNVEPKKQLNKLFNGFSAQHLGPCLGHHGPSRGHLGAVLKLSCASRLVVSSIWKCIESSRCLTAVLSPRRCIATPEMVMGLASSASP